MRIISSPAGFSIARGLLPGKIYKFRAKPPTLVHPDSFSGTPNQLASPEKYRTLRESYDQSIADAVGYHQQWCLAEADYTTLRSLFDEFNKREGQFVSQIAYDTFETLRAPLRVRSLDLIGVRQRLPIHAIRSPEDLLENKSVYITSRCFDLISNFAKLENLFLNYANCNVEDFSNWLNRRAELDVLGIPLGIDADRISKHLKISTIKILDISGYESNLSALNDLVEVISRSSVRWIMLSEFVTFDLDSIRIDWKRASGTFNGFIGPFQLGLRG